MANKALYEIMKQEILQKQKEEINRKQKQIIINLKKIGNSDETISDIMEMPVEEIRKLIQDNDIISKNHKTENCKEEHIYELCCL